MNKEIIMVAGVSGSGRTTVMQVLMDEGYVILENITSSSLKDILNVLIKNEDSYQIAIVIDVKDKGKLERRLKIVEEIEKEEKIKIKSVYITAETPVLIKRFQEFRKTHPLKRTNVSVTLLEAIEMEKTNGEILRENSDFVLDTTNSTIQETKAIIRHWINTEEKFVINLQSFGFKHGIPLDSDFVCDVRFLPNPHYIPELKKKTGEDQAVYDYVFSFNDANEYFEQLKKLLELTINGYIKEGRMVANISIGCTGGKHRSVAFVSRLRDELDFPNIYVNHIEEKKGNW